MLIKSDSTTTNSSPLMPAATACGNCGAEERRLLHQVRHRSIFRRLCTTCVLRLHPQAFCPTCFQVYAPTPPNDAVRTCVKCYSHSHSHCVESASVGGGGNPYVCPLCVHPNAPVFKLKSAKEANVAVVEAMNARIEDCRVMDRDAAKMLLAAAKIASTSMNKAAVAQKAEAERRVKEAAFTRKRAKEALEHVAHLVIKEKARRKEAALGGPAAADVAGRGYGGIVSNGGGYAAPLGRMGAEMSVSNRNGGMASVSRPFVVVEENSKNAGNVDRDNSNQVLAALNAVELRENEKIGSGEGSGVEIRENEKIEGGEGSGVTRADDHAPMDVDVDVDESGMMLNAGESVAGMNNDSNIDHAMEIGVGNVSNQGEKLDDEMVGVQHLVPNEEHNNGGGML
ncbi:hypothetical protein C2S52_008180 [Perilla frutescens var. hirtella]|nr:hypothetical protein C2S52_008180 [Perilla frutescens var. hirtella]